MNSHLFLLTVLVASLTGIKTATPADGPPAEQDTVGVSGPRYYGCSPNALPETKQRIVAGDITLQPAMQKLQQRAEQALKVKPPSVTEKQKTGASGDVHDYYSQAPYFWLRAIARR